MTSFLNRCKWNATSNGTGDFVVASGSSDGGYTPAQCANPSVSNGATYHYAAQSSDGTQHEEGGGAFNTGTNTLARTTIRNSSAGGAKVNFNSAPIVFMGGPDANDMGSPSIGSPVSGGTQGDSLIVGAAGVLAQAAGFPSYYVDGSAGNDSNDGLSTATAWKTISHVNAQTFQPGTAILFAGGQTFSGAIVCPSGGTPAKPITFGSYGSGKATISSGTSNGFSSTNFSGIIVRDLIFTGSASANRGVIFDNNLASNVHLQNIQVLGCDVSGYGLDGIFITGSNGTAGYDNVLIDRCTITGTCSVANSGHGTAGILVHSNTGYGSGSTSPSFKNVVISNCLAKSNLGTTDTNWTGSGIAVFQTRNGLVINCTADSNGGGSISSGGGGPAGIWTADNDTVNIVASVSKNNASGNAEDGGGFGTDGGSLNCTISDCLSINNAAAGYQIFSYNDGVLTTPNDGTAIINCVSIGDGAAAANNTPCALRIGQGTAVLTNVRVSGCNFYQTVSTAYGAYIDSTVATGNITDNSFIHVAGISVVFASGNPSSLTLSGNRYSASAAGATISWNGTSYSDVQQWVDAVGQEAQFPNLGRVSPPFNVSTGALDSSIFSFTNPGSFVSAVDGSVNTSGVYVTYNNTAAGNAFYAIKTRAATTAPTTAVQAGDRFMNFIGLGADGSAWQEATKFRMLVDPDGTVSAGNVPGMFAFFTAGNSGGDLCRVAIDRNGQLRMGSGYVMGFSPNTDPSSTGGAIDTSISRVAPVSSVSTFAFGNGTAGDASATFKAKTKAGAFTTSDVPAGTWVLGRDTTNSTTKMYYNNAGTLQVVALV